jgi:hypothetical protein
MSKVRMISAGAFVAAMAFAVHGPAFAGGSADSPFGALAQSQLSTAQLGSARGGSGVNILDGTNTLTDSLNTTNNTLNVTSSSGGTVDGSVSGLSMTGSVIGTTIENNNGFVNAFSNTGNNVEMNSSMSVFINAN